MKILVPYDGSEEAEEALRFALHTHEAAEVVVLHIIDPIGKGGKKQPKAAWWNMWGEDMEKRAGDVLETAEKIAEDNGRELTTVLRSGKPSKEILDYIREEGMEAVVMGRTGERGLSRILLGSVANRVARHADVPVTVIGDSNE